MSIPAISADEQTVQVDNIILKLDELARGYEEVLAMAKRQLENFEIKEDDWNRLYINVARRVDDWEIAYQLGNRIAQGLEMIADDPNANDPDARMANMITERILERIEIRMRGYMITDAIRSDMDQRFEELKSYYRDRIDDRVETAVRNQFSSEVQNARHQTEALKIMLRSIFGPQLQDLARDAISQATNDNIF